MELWMIYIIIAVVAIVIEIMAPSMFCINFALAGIITAIVSIWIKGFYPLLGIFIVLSLLSIIFLKPVLEKTLSKEHKADFDSQYIGKVVKSIETISQTQGAVTIYDERWEARTKGDCEEIPQDCDVKIIGNEGLTLFVEKV